MSPKKPEGAARHLRIVPGGDESRSASLLSLSDFSLGSFGGTPVTLLRSTTWLLNLDRNCMALARSRKLQEEVLVLPVGGSLADLQVADAHCPFPGDLGAYLSAAKRMCKAAAELPSIAERLGVRLADLQLPITSIGYFGSDVDWQAIGMASHVRDELRRTRAISELSSEHEAQVRASAEKVAAKADSLYARALEQARSPVGKRALGRMLAATCVHNGRLPRQYAPIYERFREVVAQALDLGRGVDPKRGATVADSLEWRESFDLAQRWLQAMESTGDPKGVMAILREKMTP